MASQVASQDLPKPDHARNMRLIGHSDQGGRPDGVQLMVNKGYAYTGHMFSKGFSIIDVRDPRNPVPVNYIAAPHNTWNIHLQTHDDLLLVINAKDMFAASEFQDEKQYYTGALGQKVGTAAAQAAAARDWTAGLTVYDISRPAEPRQIGFMPVAGGGIHRIWYTGGRWAYVSALLDGFTDYIFMSIDMSDPANPREAGRYWLPGMNLAAGETPTWPPQRRYGLHHPIISGDTAYAAWRDAGLVMIDVADRTAPKLITHRNWSPPFGGGTHNCLPLPDRDLLVVLDEAVLDNQEDGLKLIWLFDIREPTNPVSISTFPTPAEDDYVRKGGHFGPHNVHENRPGSFVSSELIFATYQNAGVRVFDIRNPYRPEEIAAFVPPAPARLVDHRPNRPRVIQSCDVFVDAQGLVYSNDYNGGLFILEYQG
ncbi:LVIVD repeat-containing protein [Chelatococcus sp. GCM10030263]|uniref:LVIVD repeat-containing protein n=1 Tax=Chelatococcus sp. GCM10030263 TaxID=3273387 RepID=UPI00361362E4